MAYGISNQLQQAEEASKLSIEELMRLQSMDPSFVYTIALQEKQKQAAAAANQAALGAQTDTSTITSQMEQDLASRRAPGVQIAAGRSMPQPQGMPQGMPQAQPQARGIASAPAPNMQAIGRARGGIIGYMEGGDVDGQGAQEQDPMQAQLEAFMKLQDAYNKLRASGAPQETLDRIQADLDSYSNVNQGGYNIEIEAAKARGEYGSPDGMAMGGVVGYAGGGEIKAYLASMGRDIADFTQEQITAISDMLDSQVARGQNDTLRGVARGAMDVLRDRKPSGATSGEARDFNRETMQARNERDIGPSLTDRLNAAQRNINAENDASMQDVMTSPDNKMGIANIVNAISNAGGERVSMEDVMASSDNNMGIANIRSGVANAGGERVSMEDVMASPDNNAGIANLLSEAKDFIAERDPRNSTMGQVLYDAIEEDISAIPGNISDFINASGLGDLDYDAMARAVLPRATNVAENSDDPSLGRYLGAFVNDLITGPGRLVEGVAESDFVSDIREGYGGEESAPVAVQKPLTEADIFRRDAPAGFVSAIDAAEGEQAALRSMFPNAPEMTAQQRTDERARVARGGGDRPAQRSAGLSGLLEQAKPYASTAASIAQILGRGAGASKGFEGAKFVEESARLRAAEQARQDRKEALDAELGVRREQISATKATAEAAAGARLSQAEAKMVADYIGGMQFGLDVKALAEKQGKSPDDPSVAQAVIRTFLSLIPSSVGGMGGLETQQGLSAEQRARLEAFVAS